MTIVYSKQAQKFLNKQSALTRKRITLAIENLPSGDVKKLAGYKDLYRLRIGNFRVIFNKDGEILYILKVDNRGDVYKK